MVTAGAAGYQVYQKNKYETASPHKLISMLYEGCLKFGRQAVSALEEKNIQLSHQSITKMQDIIFELLACLDEKRGGEIASNLSQLYLYMIDRLTQANLKKSKEPVLEVMGLIEELKSAWEQIGRDASLTNGNSAY